jgi:hypothetical protein
MKTFIGSNSPVLKLDVAGETKEPVHLLDSFSTFRQQKRGGCYILKVGSLTEHDLVGTLHVYSILSVQIV